jgi:diguanylate cyclase (GGDEF)-like protein/PAS domain S-box-containing protein
MDEQELAEILRENRELQAKNAEQCRLLISLQESLQSLSERREGLLQTTQSALVEATNLYKAAQAILAATDIPTISRNLDRAFRDLVDCDQTLLQLVDCEKRQVIFGVHDGEYIQLFSYDELEMGISGIVFRTFQPVLSLDPNDEIEPEVTKPLRIEGRVDSLIVVPLIARGKIIGTFTASNFVGQRKLNQHDVELLVNMANSAAIAIDNLRLMDELQTTNSRLGAIFAYSAFGIALVARHETIIDINPAYVQMLKYQREQIIGRKFIEFTYPDDVGVGLNLFQEVINGVRESFSLQKRYVCSDGEVIWVQLTVSAVRDSQNKLVYTISLCEDITERKKAEEKLQYLSFHDILTGLYNRTYFEEEIERLEAGRQYPISIITMDVDGLKQVNDNFGHPCGDALLVRVANVLTSVFRAEDVVARIGGDEFSVLLPETDQVSLENVISRLCQQFARQNEQKPANPISISMGGATAEHGLSLRELFKLADDRMYKQKRSKNRAQNG